MANQKGCKNTPFDTGKIFQLFNSNKPRTTKNILTLF